MLSRLWVVSLLVFVVTLMAIERTIARRMFTACAGNGQICRPVLIVGTDADAVALLHAAQRRRTSATGSSGSSGPTTSAPAAAARCSAADRAHR